MTTNAAGPPPTDAEIRAALAAGDPDHLARALSAGTLVVLTTVTDGASAPLIATVPDGQRWLPVFTGPDAALAWQPADDAYGVVRGDDLLGMARQQRVDGVLFDSAGPVPVEITLARLTEIAGGVE